MQTFIKVRWFALSIIAQSTLAGCVWAADPTAAAPRQSISSPLSEKALVARIRQHRDLGEVSAPFADAIRGIDQRRGDLQYDTAGNLVGVDLANDRGSATDAEMPLLAALPHLKRLRVAGSITCAAIKGLCRLTNLVELTLIGSEIDDATLAELSCLTKLSSLSLQRSVNLTDAGLSHLWRFPRLESLGILESGITNAGLPQLA
ncbi:MAG: hypothetical protein ACLP9L_02380 [Thermoguttaceae bacterium]